MKVPQLRTAGYLVAAGYLVPFAVTGLILAELSDVDSGTMGVAAGAAGFTIAAVVGLGALFLVGGLAVAVARAREAADPRGARWLAVATLPGLGATAALLYGALG